MMKSIFLLIICAFAISEVSTIQLEKRIRPITCDDVLGLITDFEDMLANPGNGNPQYLRLAPRFLQMLEVIKIEVCGDAPPCNLFLFGDELFNGFFATSFEAPSSDIEGRLAAGTSISVDSYSFGSQIPKLFGEDHDVAVAITGGNFTMNTGFVFGGKIIYGDSATVKHPIDAELVKQEGYLDFTDMAEFFVWESELLQQQEALEVLGGTLNGHLNEVFNIKCSDLEKLSNLHIMNDDKSRPVVVNLLGETCSLSNIGITTTGGCSNIIYNFPTATSLTISDVTVTGSILAPRANIIGESGQINGHVVGNSWSGPAQINWCESQGCPAGFKGSFPLNNRESELVSPAEPEEYSRGGVIP